MNNSKKVNEKWSKKDHKKVYSRSDRAITLIALILTIIVLLILAGVTINLAVNNQGIFNKAKTATGAYKSAAEGEQSGLDEANKEIAKYMQDHTATSNIEKSDVKNINFKKNKGTLSINKTKNLKLIINNDENNIVNGISWNSGNTSVANIISTDKNSAIIKGIAEGETTISATVGELTTTYNIKVQENFPVITNYNANGYLWLLYDDDGTNKYLITADYIKYEDIPSKTVGSLTAKPAKDTYNSGYFYKTMDLFKLYNGSSDILGDKMNTDTNIRNEIINLNSQLLSNKENANLTNGDSKIMAYMMDTNIWNNFCDSEYAKFAIGGPTAELLAKAYGRYKETQLCKVDCVDYGEGGYGYRIEYNGEVDPNLDMVQPFFVTDKTQKIKSWNETLSHDGSTLTITYGENDTSQSAIQYWLASPHANDPEHQLMVNDTYWSIYNCQLTGFRPIVSLKSNVKMIENEDGSYTLINQ